MTAESERQFIGAVLAMPLVCALACRGGGDGAADASVDAGKDTSMRVADAGVDRAVPSLETDGDAVPGERHLVDAAVQCEGGGRWGPCFVTDAAELACEASTDCTWQSNGGTCCGVLTVGVNKSAPPVGCPPPPCPPPKEYQSACYEFYAQDCQVVDAADHIIVECVNHRCMTRASSN